MSPTFGITDNFGVEAEWHFNCFALLGKSVGDGAARTLKQLATKSSLQRPYAEQLTTPRQLFDYACLTRDWTMHA